VLFVLSLSIFAEQKSQIIFGLQFQIEASIVNLLTFVSVQLRSEKIGANAMGKG